MMVYDIAIIGAGPAGMSISKGLVGKGKKIVLFEKNHNGGVCLNEGCMPTKGLLASAGVLDTVRSASKFGIQVSGDISFDYAQIAGRKDQIIQALRGGTNQNIASLGMDEVNAFAQLDGEDEDGNIKILAEGKTYKAKKVILTTGSENFVPPIPGLTESGYIGSREVLDLKEAPKSMTVIGGGVLGVEFAALFSTFGTKVDLVEMANEILPNMDREMATVIRETYAAQGVTFHLGTSATKVNGKEVTIRKGDKTEVLKNDTILLAVGRKASTKGLNLESMNLKLDRGAVVVDDKMQTSHPNIYACGDLIGGSMLAHTAIHEGDVVVAHLLGENHRLNYNSVPSVVYTNPEIASVGAREEDLKAQGVKYSVAKAPLAMSGRYILDNDFQTPGFIKILIDEEKKIRGVHILGNPASELISIAAMAIAEGYTIDKMKRVVYPHPTVAGIFRNALM